MKVKRAGFAKVAIGTPEGSKAKLRHALWKSSVLGNRRKGTRLSELRSVLGAGITAYAILESLESCSSDDDALEAAKFLKDHGFDVAGVKRPEDGRMIGYVEQRSLTHGTVADCMKPLTVDCLIADTTPLPEALSYLKSRAFAFVLVGTNVEGIVTRADLNKPPVRVYLFGLISLLEMHMGHWIRMKYAAESWKAHLSEGRLNAAIQRQEERRKRNQDIDLVECLQFCDKRDLILEIDEVREGLGLGGKKAGAKFLKRAEALRDLLAHSQQDLVEGSSWEELIDLVEGLEVVLERSDDLIEAAFPYQAEQRRTEVSP